ncbi:MAG: SDR family NAD(P)-dependent oxidoreductase [Patescibacteria group bacterium]|nr:SDR family NAD(P)-dependent oxidoreductase [Patescibacteria group bacterium]
MKTKLALITGGANGIGFEIVKILLKNKFCVFIIDKDDTKLRKIKRDFNKNSFNIITKNIDLSDKKQLNSFIKYLDRNNYAFDLLINNAAYQEDVDILDMTINQWEKLLNVNLNSAFLLSQYVAKKMIKYKISGNIINITSIHSFIPRGIVHYSCSKAALDMLTKELVLKLSKNNIRVNSIAPGSIYTNMNSKYINTKHDLDNINKKIPLQRMGNPKDISHVVDFLISNKAKYITGITIIVDGGLSLVI